MFIEQRARGLLTWLFVLAVGAALTWQVYHYQFSSHFDLFPGPKGDTRLTAYLTEHWYQWLRGHGDLASPAMFYPIKGTLGFSEVFLAYVPGYSLLRLWGANVYLALGLVVIFFCYLNFLMCLVVLRRAFKFGLVASCVGALFFAFNNPKLAQPDHLQLQPVFLLPIVLGLVVAFFVKSRSLTEAKAFLYLAVAGIALNVQLLTSFYIGWFFIFGSLLFLSLSLVFARSRVLILDALYFHRRTVAASAVVFLVGFIPFVLIYLPAVRSTSWYGLLPEYIPETKSFLLMADGNYIWRSVTAAILARGSTQDWGRRIGIGLVPIESLDSRRLILSIGSLAKEFGILDPVTNRAPLKHLARRGTNISSCDNCRNRYLLHTRVAVSRAHTMEDGLHLVPGAKAIRAVARYAIVLALPMAIAFAFIVQYGIIKLLRERMSFPGRPSGLSCSSSSRSIVRAIE